MCDGLMDVKKVVSNAKSLGMEAVSITDFMNQCNAVKLYECGMGQGVKPIFGIELNVYDDTKKNAAEHTFFRIKLYAITLLDTEIS
jgi:DNA polymerase-3 subunit alpha